MRNSSMEKVKQHIEKILSLLCLATCLWILGCLLFKNGIWDHNRIILLCGVATVVYLLFKVKEWLSRYESWLEKYFVWILLIFLALYGILQLLIALKLRFVPVFDLEAIWGGAIEWYETGDFVQHEWYFYRNKNNMGGLLVLYLANLLMGGITRDYFLIGVVVNVLGILITVCLLALSCRDLWGAVAGVLVLVMVSMMLPYLFMGAAFYTDALSLPYVMAVLYVFIRMIKTKKMSYQILAALIIGCLGAIGGWIKGTTWIVVMAAGIVLFLRKNAKTVAFCGGSILIAAFAVNILVQAAIYGNHLQEKDRRSEVPPSTHWIMMGLEGNGAYNPQDFEFTYSFTDYEERDRAIEREIINRIRKRGIGGMLELFTSKTVMDYGEGTLGLSDFLDDGPINDSSFHDYVLYQGQHYSIYRGYCSIIVFSFLLFFLYGVYQKCGNVNQGEGANTLIHVSFLGIFALLMIWETNYRYFTNYTPILILGGVMGIMGIQRQIAHNSLKNLKDRFLQWKYTEKYLEMVRFIWSKRSVRIFSYAVLLRIAVYLLSVGIMAIFGDYSEGIIFSDFLEAWKRWDSAHYLNIAENGYSGAVENGEHIFLVFYPLYPWLIKVLSYVVKDFRLAGLLISVISYGIGNVYFDKIMIHEFDGEASKEAGALLTVFPFSFFFGAIMTESLYFALLTAFFYHLRNHNWNQTTVLGFLACLTKVQGVLLAFSIAAELCYSNQGFVLLKQKQWRVFWDRIILQGLRCVPMLGGLLVYMLVNYVVEADPLRFMYYQKNHWGNALCPIWETITYIKNYVWEGWHTSTGMSLWVPEFVLFFVYLAGIVYGWVKKLRPMYLVYLVVFYLLTYSSTWLISGGRYTLSALPLFMLGGKWLAEHRKTAPVILSASGVLMMIYLIGYYQWKQIM